MINNSLLLRTAGNHPLIQVRERSAWVRDFPDVPRSILDASRIPDWWKAGICVRELATGVGPMVRLFNSGKIKPRAASPSRGQIHAFCSESRRSAYGDQPRLRSANRSRSL